MSPITRVSMRQTHTYVVLDLTPEAYAEIRAKLLAAGYTHAIMRDDGREVIDMQGIVLGKEAVGKDGDE